jgi:hypothetical protein
VPFHSSHAAVTFLSKLLSHPLKTPEQDKSKPQEPRSERTAVCIQGCCEALHGCRTSFVWRQNLRAQMCDAAGDSDHVMWLFVERHCTNWLNTRFLCWTSHCAVYIKLQLPVTINTTNLLYYIDMQLHMSTTGGLTQAVHYIYIIIYGGQIQTWPPITDIAQLKFGMSLLGWPEYDHAVGKSCSHTSV